MNQSFNTHKTMLPIVAGLISGLLISAIDNYTLGGEITPPVIVLLLLLSCGISGIIWGSRGWLFAISTWIFIPSSHFIKHIFGMPDTIYPNTYPSILKLAIFTLIISAAGFMTGKFLRKLFGSDK